jgi:hypothetical protein
MSRPTVVRRLTAVLALLAVLCLALPAMAAPGGRAQSSRPHAVHAAGVLDQIFSWIGSFWAAPGPGQADRTDKAGSLVPSPGSSNTVSPVRQDADKGGQLDPNG